ncbi:GTPase family protein [Photobacterium aphoticum]|uniref:GTPase family protein n=1 Tax=Photobacterium aphoticum TaxID=754436 RepID=UPI000A8A6F5A|nr:dynamin family protein [Photobacterium aphoticum]
MNLLSRTSAGVIPLILMALVLPVLALAGLGLVSVVENGYWLMLSLVLVGSSLLVLAGYLWVRRQASEPDVTEDDLKGDIAVAPSGEWGAFDRDVWQSLNVRSKDLLAQDDSWPALREHSMALAMEVSARYAAERKGKSGHAGQEWAFTAPEFLLMMEQVSKRYRHFLLNHVPFAEHLKISTLQQGYRHKEKLGAAKKLYDAYRLFRAFTPAGIVAEARGQIFGALFDQVSDEVQHKLKKVLLQEVISVAIDLYSGRYSVTDGELGESTVKQQDEGRLAEEIEPLRVALVGQVSAGKSSFVNAFVGSMVAEVSAIPSTDKIVIHRCHVEGVDLIHLVDLPGIDGNEKTQALLLEQMTQSDVIFWLVKANQPARQQDVMLKQLFDDFYLQPKNRSRKKPRVIMLLNQVDRLQPANEWAPPYDMTQPTDAKGKIIKAALDFNLEQLKPDEGIVIAMPEQQPSYNMAEVGESLLGSFEEGINTQLNRRRLSHGSADLTQQAKRLYSLGKVAAKHWLKEQY